MTITREDIEARIGEPHYASGDYARWDWCMATIPIINGSPVVAELRRGRAGTVLTYRDADVALPTTDDLDAFLRLTRWPRVDGGGA